MGIVATEKIGRNEPCPCGSGKKYKKCCFINDEKHPILGINYLNEEVRYDKQTLLEINNQIDLLPFKKALKDEKMFANFSRKDIENLSIDNLQGLTISEGLELLKELYQLYENGNGEIIEKTSCKKGCSACCNLYVDVSPLEAEYVRRYVIDTFSEKEIKQLSNVVKNKSLQAPSPEIINQNLKLKDDFAFKKIPCAFLSQNGTCTIYDVRPFNCRKHKVISDPIHCYDPNSKKPNRIILQIDSSTDLAIKKLNAFVYGSYFYIRRGLQTDLFYKHLPQWFIDEFESIG